MQVPVYEELSAKGAYSSSQMYSPEDMEELVAYAGEVSLFPYRYV